MADGIIAADPFGTLTPPEAPEQLVEVPPTMSYANSSRNAMAARNRDRMMLAGKRFRQMLDRVGKSVADEHAV